MGSSHLRIAVNAWAHAVRPESPTLILGVEARGFPLGAALAYELGCGFISLRKEGKLPRSVHRREYQLEYGSAALELHRDSLTPADRVVIVDDVLATGGTAAAAIELVQAAGAHVISFAVIMDLPFLDGTAPIIALGVTPHILINDHGSAYQRDQ